MSELNSGKLLGGIMAQELKACEAYICHNEFSLNELPQKKDAIVKSASHKEEDDWWDYAAKIECYRKEDADKVIAELESENESLLQQNRELCQALQVMYGKDAYDKQKYKRCLAMAKWCASRSVCWLLDPADDELHKSEFYEKWKLRWRELAERFK